MALIRNAALLWSVPLLLALTGCPYQSEVPLDTPSVPVDSRLLGTWQDGSAPNSSVYRVEPSDPFHYRIHSETESGSTEFEGFLSQVGERTYLNLRESSAATYWLFWLEVAPEGTSLTLHPVTENITESFSLPDDLRSFVTQNQNLSFFFEKPTTYLHPEAPLP